MGCNCHPYVDWSNGRGLFNNFSKDKAEIKPVALFHARVHHSPRQAEGHLKPYTPTQLVHKCTTKSGGVRSVGAANVYCKAGCHNVCV